MKDWRKDPATLAVVFATCSRNTVPLPAWMDESGERSDGSEEWRKSSTPHRLSLKYARNKAHRGSMMSSRAKECPDPPKSTRINCVACRVASSTTVSERPVPTPSSSPPATSAPHLTSRSPDHLTRALSFATSTRCPRQQSSIRGGQDRKVIYLPLSTIVVKWQLHRFFPPYNPQELRFVMSRFGVVVMVWPTSSNSAVLVYSELESARRAVSSTTLGRPLCRLTCHWLYPALAQPNILAALRHTPVHARHLLSLVNVLGGLRG